MRFYTEVGFYIEDNSVFRLDKLFDHKRRSTTAFINARFWYLKTWLSRVAVGLGWTRARASNPRVGQGWAHSFCPEELNGFGFLFKRIDRIRVLVRLIESNKHTCSSSTQSEFRFIQKSRVEWSILGLNGQICSTGWAEQAILSELELWASSDVLTLGLSSGFCSSNWVGLKKSVRTYPDDHTMTESFIFFNDDVESILHAFFCEWKQFE
jgi:hypothetical protein